MVDGASFCIILLCGPGYSSVQEGLDCLCHNYSDLDIITYVLAIKEFSFIPIRIQHALDLAISVGSYGYSVMTPLRYVED